MRTSTCIACDSARLRLLDSRTVPRGVTSDCKPWPRAGTFAICEACGHTQKIQDQVWNDDVAQIYGGYEVYFLSGGNEQVVFDGFQPLPRTQRLLEKFRQRTTLPARGRMLDVGCANGSTLRTFASLFPQWQLAGFDINTHSEAAVRAIPGVTDFFTGTLDAIDQKFDLVTMVYVVEHLPDPRPVLNQLRRLLKPGGIIWVHTSDFWANPFDLTVVDHSSHFMLDTLWELVERCGFEVIDGNDDWNPKELGVIARWRETGAAAPVDAAKTAHRLEGAPRRLQWLGEVVAQARAAAPAGQLGIFGTTIGGTWLASMTPYEAGFFVDEDQLRVGKKHLGFDVIAPVNVPDGAPVYLAFPAFQAVRIRDRLRDKHDKITFLFPGEIAG